MGIFGRLFGGSSNSIDPRIVEVLRYLNDAQTRATYGAVADVVGGIARGIGARLGPRRIEASWVVESKSGMPSGYRKDELHPLLIKRSEIIRSGAELQRRMNLVKTRRP
jgi:hypothetical protein